MVGWVTDTHLLLLPGEARTFLHRAMQSKGKTFPIDWNTLLVQLDAAGHIETQTEKGKTGGDVRRREVVEWVSSAVKSKRVVKLNLAALDVDERPTAPAAPPPDASPLAQLV
jgi:hypothetical protein